MTNMWDRSLLAVFLSLCLFVFESCSSKNALIVGRLPGNTRCVAVMPFVTQGDPQRSNREFLSEFVSSDLFRGGVTGIIYPTEILKAYNVSGIGFPQKADMSYAKEVAKVLGVDSVLWGEISYMTVFEDAQIQNKAAKIGTGAKTGTEVYLIAVEAYLINGGTGAVRWYYDSKKVSNYENDVNVLAKISSEIVWGLLRSQEDQSYDEDKGCLKTALSDRIALLKGTSYGVRSQVQKTAEKTKPDDNIPALRLEESDVRMGTEVVQTQARTLSEEERLLHDSLIGGKKILLQKLEFAGRTPNLSKNGMVYLNSLGNVLVSLPNHKFVFESHVDATSDTASDMRLSLDRVKNIKVFLVKYFNVDPDKLEIKALGGQLPILPNISKRGREKNRRIELTALKLR